MKKLIAFLLFSVSVSAQTTVVLQPNSAGGKDAMLHEYDPNGMYGDNHQLPVLAWTFSGTPGTVRSLLEFDLSSIPANAVILEARLSLYSHDDTAPTMGQHSPLSGSNNGFIQKVTSSWNENTVTWNNQPTSTTIGQVSIPASTSPNQNYLDIDVTNLVSDMYADPSNNYGFLLKLETESAYRMLNFASSDHLNSSLHPKLEIVYEEGVTCVNLRPNPVGGKDAMLHEYDPNGIYGDNHQLPVLAWTFTGTPGSVRSLIEFDLSSIPANSVIAEANLSLYAHDDTAPTMGQHSPLSGPNNGFIQKVTSNWDESTVTWNNQPTSTTVGQVSLPVSTSPDEDYLDIDVTNLVEDMYANPSSNYGFMLKLETESAYRMLNFASSDHLNANLHPQLEVCYTGELSLIEFNSDLASQILIYPNPANEFINVQIVNTDLIGAKFKIFDDLGREVYSHSVDSESFSVDVSSFAKGLYMINLSDNLHNAIRFVKL